MPKVGSIVVNIGLNGKTYTGSIPASSSVAVIIPAADLQAISDGQSTITANVSDLAENPAVQFSVPFSADVTTPASFTTGSITIIGGTVVSGYWNNTNTKLEIVVPIANDTSLDFDLGEDIVFLEDRVLYL